MPPKNFKILGGVGINNRLVFFSPPFSKIRPPPPLPFLEKKKLGKIFNFNPKKPFKLNSKNFNKKKVGDKNWGKKSFPNKKPFYKISPVFKKAQNRKCPLTKITKEVWKKKKKKIKAFFKKILGENWKKMVFFNIRLEKPFPQKLAVRIHFF